MDGNGPGTSADDAPAAAAQPCFFYISQVLIQPLVHALAHLTDDNDNHRGPEYYKQHLECNRIQDFYVFLFVFS